MKKLFKISAVLMATMAIVPLAACGSGSSFGNGDNIDTNYQWLNSNIKDTSDLEAYTGTQMNLAAWNTMGFSQTNTSSNDVITPEIKRVTGVTIDKIWSANNEDVVGSWEQVVLSGNIPQVVIGANHFILRQDLFDLSELVKQYCPTLMERVPKSVWAQLYEKDGGLYSLPWNIYSGSIADIDPMAKSEAQGGWLKEGQSTIMFDDDNDYYPYVLVRDDVLEDAFGAENVYTQAELNEIYKERGYFTEDEIFDIKIESAEEFRTEFLPAIDRVLDTNDYYKEKTTGDRVQTMVIMNGDDSDSWDFLGVLIPKLLGATGNHKNTQYSYWDAKTQKVEMMMTQDFYKDEVYEWAKL